MAVTAPPRPDVEIDDGVIEEARRRQQRRRGVMACVLMVGLLVGAGLALGIGGGGGARGRATRADRPSPSRSGSTQAGRGPGAILHIDSTLTTRFSDGRSYTTRQDVWQQQNAVPNGAQAAAGCSWLNLRKSSPGTPAGTEGGTVNGRDELYDPIRNTIYIAPPIKLPPTRPRVTLPNECSYMAGFAKQVRGLLTSGRARVAGRAKIDGKDTIKIVFAERVSGTRASVPSTYYVAADGTYAPVKLVSGRPTDPDGVSTTLFHTYAELPGSRHSRLLNLAAQHPTATIDRNLADYRAASGRLFPNG